jgi:hypothetical protein
MGDRAPFINRLIPGRNLNPSSGWDRRVFVWSPGFSQRGCGSGEGLENLHASFVSRIIPPEGGAPNPECVTEITVIPIRAVF